MAKKELTGSIMKYASYRSCGKSFAVRRFGLKVLTSIGIRTRIYPKIPISTGYFIIKTWVLLDARKFINDTRESMCKALCSLNKSIPGNKQVRLLANNKNHISLSPLTEQAEPVNINRLKGLRQTTWPMTSLLDILKEADLRIGFTQCFKTQRSSERLHRNELQKRLLLCLYGLGTNTGLKRISAGRHGVGYKDLLHVRKSYIYKSVIREAIAKVVNATFGIRNPGFWGEGTTACASDSKKFGSWNQNLMTE